MKANKIWLIPGFLNLLLGYWHSFDNQFPQATYFTLLAFLFLWLGNAERD